MLLSCWKVNSSPSLWGKADWTRFLPIITPSHLFLCWKTHALMQPLQNITAVTQWCVVLYSLFAVFLQYYFRALLHTRCNILCICIGVYMYLYVQYVNFRLQLYICTHKFSIRFIIFFFSPIWTILYMLVTWNPNKNLFKLQVVMQQNRNHGTGDEYFCKALYVYVCRCVCIYFYFHSFWSLLWSHYNVLVRHWTL
jgi:hypothetical protein